jgi:hypothetical protein
MVTFSQVCVVFVVLFFIFSCWLFTESGELLYAAKEHLQTSQGLLNQAKFLSQISKHVASKRETE